MPVIAILSSGSPALHNDLGGSDTSSEIVISVSYPFFVYTGHNLSISSTMPVYAAKPGHPVFASANFPILNSSPEVHSPALYSILMTDIISARK